IASQTVELVDDEVGVLPRKARLKRRFEAGTPGERARPTAHPILDEERRLRQFDAKLLLAMLADSEGLLREAELVYLLICADANQGARHNNTGRMLREERMQFTRHGVPSVRR